MEYLLICEFSFSKGIPEFLGSGRKSWTLDPGRWTLDAGLWTLDPGCWSLDARSWTLDAGLWMLDPGLWTLDATLRKLGSGHCSLLSNGSEQNQNPVSDSAYSIESIYRF